MSDLDLCRQGINFYGSFLRQKWPDIEAAKLPDSAKPDLTTESGQTLLIAHLKYLIGVEAVELFEAGNLCGIAENIGFAQAVLLVLGYSFEETLPAPPGEPIQ